MNAVMTFFKLAGSLCLFLYGMRILSDGIQRASGAKLKKTLNLMTGNTFTAILTGIAITAIIQSSSATTVMVISFVDAGLLSVVQASGVIFGANIGTTATAWIVSLIGLKFSVASFALPMVACGFIIGVAAKRKSSAKDYGDAVMGLGLLFLGLDFLSNSIPPLSPDTMSFLGNLSGFGVGSVLIAMLAGIVLTVIVHSSSAVTAIVITLSLEGILSFEMASGIVLGSNIGTTIDAFLASSVAKTNAKRAAWIHILFNVFGSVWAIVLFKPFLALIELLCGGMTVAQKIAMLHTVFNLINTIVFAPFTKQFAALVSKLVKQSAVEENIVPKLHYVAAPLMDSPELNLIRARKEISDMNDLCEKMFKRWCDILKKRPDDMALEIESFKNMEDYGDQMRDELSKFILDCASGTNSESQKNISAMLRIVVELEDITDQCCSLIMLLEKGDSKGTVLSEKEIEKLIPYTELVEQFLSLIGENINSSIDEQKFEIAGNLENNIDEFRSALKKKARKRLQKGSDVKRELMYIDIVRHIEKIGDHAFGIAQALRIGS